MMKILFSVFFVAISLNGRFIFWVTPTESDKLTGEGDEFHLPERVTTISEAELTSTEETEKSQHLFAETEKQELILPSQSVVEDPPFINNVEVSPELTTTAEAVVFPSADSVFEFQKKVKSQFYNDEANGSNQFFAPFENEKQEYVVHAEPKLQVRPIAEETARVEANESEPAPSPAPLSSREEPRKTAPQHEDMPSFSEWTQKQLAEAEKKKTDHNQTSDHFKKTRGKFRNKNYASPDCGAKIVASNPESVSSSAVLSPLKDEYMLNYCANRIWFVVELCEAIQAKQLDLANFELFSSSPKHFSAFVSHRFPTRDWSNVGKFTAQDSRDVQTFNLHPYLFGKYIKIELHSHYGKEQFCPISWVGVYGTSEYEVLAKEDERHSLPDEDDQYEEDSDVGHRRDSPKNLFSSATDAVLSIVKKATAPFMKTDGNDTRSETPEKTADPESTSCVSPRYIIVCNNCTQAFYDRVFYMLSCLHRDLGKLLSSPFVRRTLIDSDACAKFGLDFAGLRTGAPYPSSNHLDDPRRIVNYLTVMLGDSAVAASCNVFAVLENKVVVNATVPDPDADRTLRNVTEKSDSCEATEPSDVEGVPASTSLSARPSVPPGPTCLFPFSSPLASTSLFADVFPSQDQSAKKIDPTKTLTEDEAKMLSPSSDFPSAPASTSRETAEEKSTESAEAHVTSTPEVATTLDAESASPKEPKGFSVDSKTEPERESESELEAKNANATAGSDATLNSVIGGDANVIESSLVSSASDLPAESIFLRLANRIKNLEINMSLSSTYLEELSKRYRVQLELLSKTLNQTIRRTEDRSKADEEKQRRQEKEMISLRMQLANLSRDMAVLLRERNSWRPKASSISQHVFFISLEILLLWSVFNYWNRSYSEKRDSAERFDLSKRTAKKCRRRNSLEGVRGHETPRRKARRPSDEALEIALSRTRKEDAFKAEKKKRRRKKDSKCSISAIQIKRKKSEGSPPRNLAECSKSGSVSEESQVPETGTVREIEPNNGGFAPSSGPEPLPETLHDSANEAFQTFSAPAFVRTALAARNSRSSLLSNKASGREDSISSTKKEKKSSDGLKKYMKKFF